MIDYLQLGAAGYIEREMSKHRKEGVKRMNDDAKTLIAEVNCKRNI